MLIAVALFLELVDQIRTAKTRNANVINATFGLFSGTKNNSNVNRCSALSRALLVCVTLIMSSINRVDNTLNVLNSYIK